MTIREFLFYKTEGKPKNISIVNVHIPIDENSDEDKNIFQEQILSEHARFPKQEKNVQGVVAAKANKIEQTSDNSLRLINVALGNNLVIKSTQSEKKVIYKSSWLYPDG